MGQSIIMPQTLRLAGSRAVAHITSRDTPRPPLFRDDDGLAPLARDPWTRRRHEEVGVAGANIWCRIARPDPKIDFESLSRGDPCPSGDDRPTDDNNLTGDDS